MNNTCETKSCCGGTGKVIAWAVGVLGTTLLMVGLVAAMIHYTQPKPVGPDRAAERVKGRKEVQAAGKVALETYGWQDQARGIVRLPLDRALELAGREWQDPKAARALMLERAKVATAPLPEKKSEFE
jgi:hypothetical protein